MKVRALNVQFILRAVWLKDPSKSLWLVLQILTGTDNSRRIVFAGHF